MAIRELIAKIDPVRADPRFMRTLLTFVLLVIAYQGWILSGDYVIPVLEERLSTLSLPAWQRTALLLEGESFAGHIGFLRENTPPESTVILPPKTLNNAYEHIGLMQYMLFPRDIHNCGHSETQEECVRRMADENIYILGLDYFPPREPALETKKFLRYRGDLGVFVPR